MINPYSFSLKIKGKLFDLNSTKVMGIINATPDSFYNNSRKVYVDDAVLQAETMLNEGAHILDIGGYSSRPGAEHVKEEEELNRVLPIIEAIKTKFPEAIISIDTFRSNVAKNANYFGADIINDISGGNLDERMFDTVKELNIPYIMMHMRGTPQTMKNLTEYPEGVTFEVMKYFAEKAQEFLSDGTSDIIIDPGFGFAKTIEQNYELLHNLHLLKELNLPILVGVSRKSMITKKLGITSNEALNGTSVLNTLAILKGAHILRVHDVKPAVECVKLIQ
ncbi:dihydropteroate synthase [Flammeovirga kamogawensis]|uniref:dihydropteroate synthase n=1 Tax=Flammeovirga kamogawensis TaxID=373891 RepID=A0ABX8GZP1_9BACT|nr:dihydropteroate synthase [Flammeovirga kamogawensis]MBB6459251.1 dihydropteroate synthase [Flammeovirga kamogawensis]QWG08813.1 dihydropteroate synthase [Flammeovirga kamogawensis]TRX67102.1 dihydropteroate synthase [Flammeovirga kamogawensis]